MTLLDDVAQAAQELERAQDEVAAKRAKLHAAIMAAREESIPLAKIGKAANLSRERVRRIVLDETA